MCRKVYCTQWKEFESQSLGNGQGVFKCTSCQQK